jgi:Predicted membrane protein
MRAKYFKVGYPSFIEGTRTEVKMKNEKTRRIVVTALLVAICLLLGLTPVGYIPIGAIEITLLCIPVIIGTIMEGLGVGLILGFFFGLTSFLQIFIKPTAFSQFIFSLSAWKTVVIIFIPRMFVPVAAWLIYRALKGETRGRRRVAAGVAAFTGSLTNTVLFLGGMYLIFLPEAGQMAQAFGTTPELLLGVIAGIGAINGLPEAAVAVLLCVPVVWALQKLTNRGNSLKKTES